MRNNIKAKNTCTMDLKANDLTFKCINHFIIPTIVAVLVIYFTFYFWGEKIGIRVPDLDVTTDGLICTLFIFIIASICGKVFDHADFRVKFILIFLCTICVTLLQTFMTYIMAIAAVAPLLIAAQYSDKRALNFAFALSMISSVIIVFAGYKYGLCDANMVFAPVRRITHYTELSGAVKPIKDILMDLFILFILPRFILTFAFTMLIKSVVTNHNDMLENEVNLMQLQSEHDALTGLYNRTHYEKVLETKYETASSVLLIFFDVNNLKYVNDTKGHNAGDRLIIKAAKSIKAMSDITTDIYRFGGDEFLAVILNCEENDVKHYITKWEISLDGLNSIKDGLPCEIAIGYAFGKGYDFSRILREADMNMYKNKMETKNNREI